MKRHRTLPPSTTLTPNPLSSREIYKHWISKLATLLQQGTSSTVLLNGPFNSNKRYYLLGGESRPNGWLQLFVKKVLSPLKKGKKGKKGRKGRKGQKPTLRISIYAVY